MDCAADPKARRMEIVQRRREGATFRAIGEERGISAGRARVLYVAGLKDERDQPPSGPATLDTPGAELPISRRARDVLAGLGLNLGQILAMTAAELAIMILREPNGNRRVLNEVSGFLDCWSRQGAECLRWPSGRPA